MIVIFVSHLLGRCIFAIFCERLGRPLVAAQRGARCPLSDKLTLSPKCNTTTPTMMRPIVTFAAFVLSLLFEGTESSLFCNRPLKAIYGCRYSDYLHVTYPNPIGLVECGDIYSIKDASVTPISVTADALLDNDSLYTLLLVDTYNKVIHYGAVNLDYDFVTSNIGGFDQAASVVAPNVTDSGGGELTKTDMNIDQAEGVFVKYQGPGSSKGLFKKPISYSTLWPYEWLFARQNGIKEVPNLEKTSGFNYDEFLQEDVIIYTTFFSSGFCA